jgi:hypothetical protein
MKTLRSLALVALLPLASAAAQGAARPADAAPVRTTTTSVSRMILIRIAPGQTDAFTRDMVDNIIPTYEAYKKAGIITGYSLFTKSTAEGDADWQRGIMLTYASWAALDGLGARQDQVTLAHYGTAEKRAAANAARAAFSTVVSSWLMPGVNYTR